MPEIHLPVSLDRTVELLTPAIEGREHPIVVDATLGLAGHSFELLSRFPHLTIIGIDRDSDAIARAAERLERFHGRVQIYQNTFDNLGNILDSFGTRTVDGILLDLGVSSMQLDNVERGFSYSHESTLDMRMDRSQGLTAAEVLATYSESELTRILRQYGEERFAAKIAKAIVVERTKRPITRSSSLVELIKRVIPAPARRTGGNPAKRTFQALRIEVNGELDILDRSLPIALDRLAVGGRLVVLSFQSLEDRIVKEHFARVTARKDLPGLPVALPGEDQKFALIFNGSQKASEEEILVNPRAKSVRIRAITRVAA
jgi:16S rRNA (cytosine1402-N4)-methyltransferase